MYAALYHPAFGGTRRIGHKTYRFDRAGWLSDRQKFFGKGTAVVMKDVRIVTGERTALATFTQESPAASGLDVGVKRIEILVSNNELLITSEMLVSTSSDPERTEDRPVPEEISLLLPLYGKFGAVLRAGPFDTSSRATPIGPPGDRLDHFFAKEAPAAVTEPWKGWVGRTMNLYDEGKFACTGRVAGFSAVGGVLGTDEVVPGTPADRKGEVAWNWLPSSAKHLVAIVEPENGQCKAQWARAADLPPPVVFDQRNLSRDELTLAKRSLAKTAAARWSQIRYQAWLRYERGVASSSSAPADWMNVAPQNLAASAFTDPSTHDTYVTIELRAGKGCGSPAGYALGFFKVSAAGWSAVTGDGDPREIFPASPRWGIAPHTAVIPHAGARPVLIAREALYVQEPWGFAPIITIGPVWTISGC